MSRILKGILVVLWTMMVMMGAVTIVITADINRCNEYIKETIKDENDDEVIFVDGKRVGFGKVRLVEVRRSETGHIATIQGTVRIADEYTEYAIIMVDDKIAGNMVDNRMIYEDEELADEFGF